MSQWPLHKSYFWERIPFFRLILPLVAGILCYEFGWFSFLTISTYSALLFVSLSLFILPFLFRKHTNTTSVITFVAAHLFLLFAGWLAAYSVDIRNDKQWFGHYVEKAEAFKVIVAAKPQEKDKTWKLAVEVKTAISSNAYTPVKGSAFLYVYKDAAPIPFHEGDALLIPAQWQRIKNSGNPFEFDYARYAGRNNLYYQQFAASKNILQLHSSASIPWWQQVHEWSMAQLALYIKDKPTLGLIQAMLVGDEVNMDNEVRQAYAETGIIHIVAISGSHITAFFFLIAFLLSWIKNKKYHWLKYLLAIPLIWLYVLIAGAPPSAVRAACMFSLLGVGFTLQKQSNSLNQLFATAFILLLAQPYWLFSVGFQLSFLAVLSIVLFYKPIYNLWSPTGKIARSLWATIVVSIAAEILVAPLVIYYFHLFPAMFIVANVAAYLFMSLVLLAGMLIIVCSSLIPVATFLAIITTWLVSVFNALVQVFRNLNPDSFRFLVLKDVELLLIYIIIIALAVYIVKSKKQALFTGLIATCILVTSFILNKWQAIHQKHLVVYTIGHINHVELIDGETYTVLATDTAEKKNYTLKPAHIGWRTLAEEKPEYTSEVFHLNNHTLLLLNEKPHFQGTFPADYVIINYNASPADVEGIKNTFHPLKLVIGNNFTRKRQAAMAAAAQNNGIPVHITGSDGAFILTSR